MRAALSVSLMFVVGVLSFSSIGCLSDTGGNQGQPTTQEIIAMRTRQAHGYRILWQSAKDDVDLLCEKNVLDDTTCAELNATLTTTDGLVSELESAAAENREVDYMAMLPDVQSQILGLILDVANTRKSAKATLTVPSKAQSMVPTGTHIESSPAKAG